MLAPLQLSRARIALELGAGTGAVTQYLLDALPASSTLLVFEINRRFCNHLRRKFQDPRMVLINANVANLDAELHRRGYDHVDAVASSLGLGFMSETQRNQIFQSLMPFLREKDLTNLTKSKGVASAVVAQANKLMSQRRGGRDKK